MCIFCDIIEKKVPSEIVYEDEQTIAFQDIRPKAPVHVLIVPKKHIRSVNDITEADATVVAALFFTAQAVAETMGVKDGYKLAFNVERKGGQLVEHVHMHVLAWPDSPEGKKEVASI